MNTKMIKKIIPIALIAIPLVIVYKGSGMRGGERYNHLPQLDTTKGIPGSPVSEVLAINEAEASSYDSINYSWAAMQSITTMNSGTTNNLRDIWGNSASDIFAVGAEGIILHYNGNPEGTWSTMDNSITTNTLHGVWGSSSTDVFAVGVDGDILHYNGNPEGTWSAMDNSMRSSTLNGVWGSSSTDVFAVGWDGSIRHYDDDGSVWDEIGSNETQAHYFGGVWGSSATDVYVVGGFNDNEIFHYDGATWVNTFSSEGDELFLQAVWGSSASNVFAVGTGGITHHYKGSVWDTMNSGTTNTLKDVWGSSASNVFAVGVNGTILHYNGNPENTWSSAIESGTTKNLLGIWGSSANDVFVVGNGGTIILLHDEVTPSTSTSIPPPVTTTTIMPCTSGPQCDDSLFCNGTERCEEGMCQPGNDPCEEGEVCDEEDDECRIPPALCEISVDPTTAEVVSGQTWTFTIITTAGDCTNADYQWSVESAIGSTIDREGNYVAGINNNLFSPAADVVNVLEQTSGNEASATVTVAWQCFLLRLYGDDPETMKLLRNFRDHVLSETPEGREIIRLYYQLSPFIVATMEKDGVFKDEVRTLVEGILPLIEMQ